MKDFYYRQETEYIGILNECFATDQELLDKWHVCAPADHNTCVRKTYYDLKSYDTLKLFSLRCSTEDSDELVGWFATARIDGYSVLSGFFVKPKYRSKEGMKFFFESIEDETGMDYYTAIYEHNTRAQRFLEKNNFQLVNTLGILEEKKDILIYKNN